MFHPTHFYSALHGTLLIHPNLNFMLFWHKTDLITAVNTRKNSTTPVNTTIDMHDVEGINNNDKTSKPDKDNQQYPQILSKQDIIIIASAALILSVLAAIIVILLIFALNLSLSFLLIFGCWGLHSKPLNVNNTQKTMFIVFLHWLSW